MMLKKSILSIFSLLVLGLSSVFAHAIWIETASSGQKGQTQEIKIYFGEFATDDISSASDWFSDLSQFELKWVKPDGSSTVIPHKANGNHFLASFTPESEGANKLVLQKTASDISYGYRLDYMASAKVQIGEEALQANRQLPVAIEATTKNGSVGKALLLKHEKDISLQGEQEITVVSPNSWTKRLYPDEKGQISFTPLWPGKYLIETTVTDKNKGELNGKPYDVQFSCHTEVLEVK